MVQASSLKAADCNRSLNSYLRIFSAKDDTFLIECLGKLAEWLNAPVLKTGER